MKKLYILPLIFLLLVGCAAIKPMELPPYKAPDLSQLQKPNIPLPVEGQDYIINDDNTITLKITGLNLLTQKTISADTAWKAIEMLKQIIDIQAQIIQQDQYLIIRIDLQRQYSEKERIFATVKEYASYLVSLIFAALMVAK